MREVDFEEYLEWREDEEVRLIDVREDDEFEDVRVKEAELFPLSKIQRGELPEEDERRIAVICRSGSRSATACKVFEKAGFKQCTNIAGGTLGAIEAGEEYVERG